MDKTPPRQLILDAVVTCIEKYGIDKLTTRKIAEEAGTNIASINYYFRSKDALVEEALSMTLNHMLEDVSAAVAKQEQAFPETLQEVLFYMIDGNLRYPGITTAQLYEAVLGRNPNSPGVQAINQLFEGLAKRAAQAYPQRDPQEIRFLISQILAATMFMMLSPDFYASMDSLRVTDQDGCHSLARRYTQMFVDAVNP
jgi:AcrR family transcriptional regulator